VRRLLNFILQSLDRRDLRRFVTKQQPTFYKARAHLKTLKDKKKKKKSQRVKGTVDAVGEDRRPFQ